MYQYCYIKSTFIKWWEIKISLVSVIEIEPF